MLVSLKLLGRIVLLFLFSEMFTELELFPLCQEEFTSEVVQASSFCCGKVFKFEFSFSNFLFLVLGFVFPEVCPYHLNCRMFLHIT